MRRSEKRLYYFQAILDYISRHIQEKGSAPSLREIMSAVKLSSTSHVAHYLRALENEGYIDRASRSARGIRILRQINEPEAKARKGRAAASGAVRHLGNGALQIPMLGRIVASNPIPVPDSDLRYFDAESSFEVMSSQLPASTEGKDLFALEVEGESMIDAMIGDGDIVVLRPAQEANNGDTVAVWLTDNNETTLKKFYREDGRIRLQPANPTMQPIYIDNPKQVQIRGKVVAVFRRL